MQKESSNDKAEEDQREYDPVFDQAFSDVEQEPAEQKQDANDADKIKLLRDLKALLDEGILTPEEYEKEKAKILNSD